MTIQRIKHKERIIKPIGEAWDVVEFKQQINRGRKFEADAPSIIYKTIFLKRCNVEEINYNNTKSLTSGDINVNNIPTHKFTLVYDDDTKKIDTSFIIIRNGDIYVLLHNPKPADIINRIPQIVLEVRYQGASDLARNIIQST